MGEVLHFPKRSKRHARIMSFEEYVGAPASDKMGLSLDAMLAWFPEFGIRPTAMAVARHLALGQPDDAAAIWRETVRRLRARLGARGIGAADMDVLVRAFTDKVRSEIAKLRGERRSRIAWHAAGVRRLGAVAPDDPPVGSAEEREGGAA